MRYIIINPKQNKLMTISTFNNIEECEKEKKEKIKYWNKVCKSKELPKTRLNLWKKCKFVPYSLDSSFSDCDITFLQEKSRNNNLNTCSKVLEQVDMNNKQASINRNSIKRNGK